MSLARNDLTEFSDIERQTINDLHRREFANVTPDELRLYAEWESTVSAIEERQSEQAQANRDLIQAELSTWQTQESLAQAQLEELEAQALIRLEKAKNEQTE